MKRTMRGCLTALPVVIAGCGDSTGPELRLDPAVRVVHAAPETPQLEVVFEGETRARLEYAEVSEYLPVASGARELEVFVAGAATPIIDIAPVLDDGASYTLFAAGRASRIRSILIRDAPTPADTGRARIRLVHAAATAGTVDIYITEPGTPLSGAAPALMNVDFGDTSAYMVVDARTWQIRVTAAGTQTILIDLPLLVLSSTRVHTVVMMDTEGSGPPHGLIVLND